MEFTQYALIGSGRVAYHLEHYLRLLRLPYVTWSRKAGGDFQTAIQSSSHVLLAVSDPVIGPLASSIPSSRSIIHFSGSKREPGTFSAHPLMTFGAEREELEWYRAIPFVVDKGVEFSRILPGLTNRAFEIEPSERALYHALCALAGNSTFMLWRKIAAEFQNLELPAQILAPFLHQVVKNALGAEAVPTGPVARGDWRAVRTHLDSLQTNPSLAAAYRDFLNQAAFSGTKVPEALL